MRVFGLGYVANGLPIARAKLLDKWQLLHFYVVDFIVNVQGIIGLDFSTIFVFVECQQVNFPDP